MVERVLAELVKSSTEVSLRAGSEFAVRILTDLLQQRARVVANLRGCLQGTARSLLQCRSRVCGGTNRRAELTGG